ncbi:hypothetical protein DLJ53_03305 [Acuticoccus sediminis]|uniref:Uncharacterized protein n=2 Tax=Acuticoccus sediminis TaxID=2184697 RepID=A0A8B2NVY7_9HYPH|nr:hypothetical protein DLJ53_03305 [Acuticoccus sediminis]
MENSNGPAASVEEYRSVINDSRAGMEVFGGVIIGAGHVTFRLPAQELGALHGITDRTAIGKTVPLMSVMADHAPAARRRMTGTSRAGIHAGPRRPRRPGPSRP